MSRTLWLVTSVLVVGGAVNWGMVGMAQFDLIATLFGGSASVVSRVVYSLVGISSLLLLLMQATLATTPAPHRSTPAMR